MSCSKGKSAKPYHVCYIDTLLSMKKITALIGSLLIGLLLFTSCNDRLSTVGSGVRPADDALVPEVDSFDLHAKTIKIDSVYDRSTYALLGHFSDATYGEYRASYICRLQSAPGFKFTHEPYKGQIKNTYVRLRYSSWVGDSTILSKATVFEVKRALPQNRYSRDLTPYLEGAKQIGFLSYRAANAKGNHELMIPVNNEIGERIYRASKESPQYFESQKSFEENLLRGLFIESSTGSGCMLSVYNTELVIEYDYEHMGKTADKKTDSLQIHTNSEVFTTTSLLYMHRQFETSRIDELLKPSDKFGYLTSPQGLALTLTLKAEDLQKSFLTKESEGATQRKLINGATLSLAVDVPPSGATILQPPAYLLLLPKDSLVSFFEEGKTELSSPRSFFLSSIYSVSKREYSFNNISTLLNDHLAKHNEKGILKKDLELIAIPVSRETTSTHGGGKITARLNNYIYPSAARVQLHKGSLTIKTISTLYKEKGGALASK